MRKTVLIVGDSSLSLLLARSFDAELARLAHLDVCFLTRDENFVYYPQLTTLVGRKAFRKKQSLLRHVRVVKGVAKQVNLKERRLVSDRGVLDYDYLIIDQTPTFTQTEIEKISTQFKELIAHIKAKHHQERSVRARFAVLGDSVASYQVALAAAADMLKMAGNLWRSLKIQTDYPSNQTIKEFLKFNGVGTTKTAELIPGIVIHAPGETLSGRSIRGALIDHHGRVMVNQYLSPDNYPETVIVATAARSRTNLLRVDQTLASQIAANIERLLEGKRQVAIDLPRDSALLTGGNSTIGWLGAMTSSRLRSRLLRSLDQRAYRRLTSD